MIGVGVGVWGISTPGGTLDGEEGWSPSWASGALHAIDFTSNQARWNGGYVGAVSRIPSLTGTLDLSTSGHRIQNASTRLIIPSPAVAYPMTLFAEFVRVTDTGGAEGLLQVDDNTNNNRATLYVSNIDQGAGTMVTGAVSQSAQLIGTLTVGPTYKLAMRAATNDVQSALGGTLGTLDSSATMPASPTYLRIGAVAGDAAIFNGYIRRIAVFASAFNDAALQAQTA